MVLNRHTLKACFDNMYKLPAKEQHEALREVLSPEDLIKVVKALHGALYHEMRSARKELRGLKETKAEGKF